MKKSICYLIVIISTITVGIIDRDVNIGDNRFSAISLMNIEVLASENSDCQGKYCTYSDSACSCSACCLQKRQRAVCNSFGCGCEDMLSY
jgi:hypothetical protein